MQPIRPHDCFITTVFFFLIAMPLYIFSVYEAGSCFSPEVLDITPEDILSRFVEVRPASLDLQDNC